MRATITKTFDGSIDTAAVNARHEAQKAMTPQERCRAMMARMTSASSRDFARGRVF